MALPCLADGSEGEVRRALTTALPDLVIMRLTIRDRDAGPNPQYWSSSAVVNDELVAKFAWSEFRATRLHREGLLIERLRSLEPRLRTPQLVVLHDDPVVVVTRRLDGEHLGWGAGTGVGAARAAQVASDLADFMVVLHQLDPAPLLDGLPTVVPTAQSDTTMLRARYGKLVDEHRARDVFEWCDWIDDVLATPGEQVIVHGDLHGDNQLWNAATGELVAIVDFEECGVADRNFDFRCIPGLLGSTDLVAAVAAAYEQRSTRPLDRGRIMAWHALTVLGDALWRTAARVALPGGGDANTYVDDLRTRLAEMDIDV